MEILARNRTALPIRTLRNDAGALDRGCDWAVSREIHREAHRAAAEMRQGSAAGRILRRRARLVCALRVSRRESETLARAAREIRRASGYFFLRSAPVAGEKLGVS